MNKKKILICIIVFIGVFSPFIPTLVFIQAFFLLFFFGIYFIVSLIFLIVSIIFKNENRRMAFFIFLILPIFILSQLASVFSVDKIQRLRSNHIIKKIEIIQAKTGSLPHEYDMNFGIKYRKIKDKEHFTISYSRGFLVTKIYYSENRIWINSD
jgi:hypothetical protein